MEPAVIVEGFARSEDMYGVKYATLIADGDSSVYCSILSSRPYADLTVKKVECRNHILRNYCYKLRDITAPAPKAVRECLDFDKSLHFKSRRVLGGRIMRLRTAITKAIVHRKAGEEPAHIKIQLLKKDIINSPSHVFGEHLHCSELDYFCDGVAKEGEENHVPDMKKCGVYKKVMEAVNRVADFSNHLIENVDSNIVEHYNSTVAMFTGGKRVNYTQKNSYFTRCAAAVVGYNSRKPFYKLHKKMTNSSPGNYAKFHELKTKRKAEQELKRRTTRPKVRRAILQTPLNGDKDYGPNAQKPDMDGETFAAKVTEHMARITKTELEIQEIETLTKNQSSSSEWFEERRTRLTASNFGLVCNRKPQSLSAPVVNKLLYTSFTSHSTRYGRIHEATALKQVEERLGVSVERSGLFIDHELPFLAATPDGLIGEDGIVEVKCPSTGSNMTPDQLIADKKGVVGSFWKQSKTGTQNINKRHQYYFQIQGQLHISRRKYCIFAIWTPLGLKLEKIAKDNGFWREEMVSKLEKFYLNCLLPELVDPRKNRSMPIREPQYIIDALDSRNLNTLQNKKLKSKSRK